MSLSIIEAAKDERIFRPFLQDKNGKIGTWNNWLACLRAIYGLPIPSKRHDVIQEVTGRDPDLLPDEAFEVILALTGRRSGKSRITAIIAVYEALLAGHENKLSQGERGYLPIISPTRSQSRIVRDYVRGVLDSTDLLRQEVVKENREGFELRSGVRIEILVGDFRTIRGYTLIGCVVDEVCFLGLDSESKVKNDTELIQAIRPALATTPGAKLICISSPYAKRGWAYRTHKLHYGNDRSKRTLVLNCESRTLNPTLPQSVVDDAMLEDPASARSEFLGLFRDDISAYLSRDVIERLVVPGRKELVFNPKLQYQSFADLSGGRSDLASLAIGHRDESGKVILDLIRKWKPPFSPGHVCREMAVELKRYRLRSVVGDNYSANFTSAAFQSAGITYRKSELNKSALYLELLPRLCSGQVELLDDPVLIDQLANLERRTRSGGRDIVDHAPGQHDDCANVVAGLTEVLCKSRVLIGAL